VKLVGIEGTAIATASNNRDLTEACENLSGSFPDSTNDGIGGLFYVTRRTVDENTKIKIVQF